MDSKIKLQIVKSITALICVGSLCATAIASSDKIAASIKTGSVSDGGTDTAQTEIYNEDTTETEAGTESSDTQTPSEDITEASAEENNEADEGTTVANNEAKAATTKTEKKQNGAPQTKAEIIAYCNKALNDAKAAKPGYTKNYVRKCEGDLPSIVLNLIKQNKQSKMAKGGDNKEDFPAGGFSWSSKLRESDVVSAVCKPNGQYYEITLKLGKETNPGKGESSSYGRVMTVITQEDAKSMLSAIKTVNLSYHDGYVYAKIDSKTGKLVKAEFSATADLSANISLLGDVKADNVISTETFSDFVW